MPHGKYREINIDEKVLKQRYKKSKKLRKRSGEVKSEDKLVSFLYDLMKIYLVPGKVESLVQDAQTQPALYSNGFLANYAKDLAQRLK